jgi:hypothetical protein
MTAGGLWRPFLDERRSYTRTDLDRQRTASDETTASGRIDGRGRTTLSQLDPLGVQLRRRIGNGSEQ